MSEKIKTMKRKLQKLRSLMEKNLEKKIPERYKEEFVDIFDSLSMKYNFLGVEPKEKDFNLVDAMINKLSD